MLGPAKVDARDHVGMLMSEALINIAPQSSAKRLGKGLLNALGIPTYWLRQCQSEFAAAGVRIWSALPVQRHRIDRIFSRSPVRLNFGCGETSRPGFDGVDRLFAKNVAIVLDLRRRLPFPAQTVDLCYSEHFLEHLTPEEGQLHLNEVWRILKPGGAYRVVVPNVMEFVRRYLAGDRAFFQIGRAHV